MDLSTLKPGERIVEILHPATHEPVGIRVSLVHIHDESLKKLKRQFQDERYRLESKGKYFKAENIENNLNELNFAAMKSWEWYNDANWQGETSPPFNKKTVLEVFDTLPWFRDQIAMEMGDDEAFFPN